MKVKHFHTRKYFIRIQKNRKELSSSVDVSTMYESHGRNNTQMVARPLVLSLSNMEKQLSANKLCQVTHVYRPSFRKKIPNKAWGIYIPNNSNLFSVFHTYYPDFIKRERFLIIICFRHINGMSKWIRASFSQDPWFPVNRYSSTLEYSHWVHG